MWMKTGSINVFFWVHKAAQIGRKIILFHVLAFYNEIEIQHIDNTDNQAKCNSVNVYLHKAVGKHYQIT